MPFPSRRAVLATAASLPFAPAMAQPGTRGRTVTVATQAIMPSMEPMDQPGQTSVAYRTQHGVFEGLLRLDYRNGMRVVPGLATAWRQVEPRLWEFTLREGVRFHDGSPMTAEDVVFSLGQERMFGPNAVGRASARLFQPTLAGAHKVDDRTVRLTTSVADPAFEARIAAWGAQVVSEGAWRRAPNFAAWSVAPIATGPYKVAGFRRDQLVELAAHPDYWNGAPPLAGVRFRVVPELASRMNALFAGDADIATDVTPDLIQEVERRRGFRVVEAGSNVHRMIIMDSKHNPVLRDVNLRRALSLAVDRRLLVESLWLGRTTIPNGLQSPTFGPLHDPERPTPAFDPDRARALVRASGYRGERIALRGTGTFYVAESATSQVLVEMWRAVGINVQMEAVENYAQWFARPGSGMYHYSSVMLFPDPNSSLVRNFGPNGQVQKTEDAWGNAEFNRLSEVIESTLDVEERKRVHLRMLDIIEWEDPAYVLLFTQNMFYGIRADLDWQPFPAHQMDFTAAGLRPA